jgi:hypothetical protein
MAIEVKRGTATVGVYERLQALAKAEGVGLATIVGGLLWWACSRLSDEEIMTIYRSLLIARKGTRGGGRKKKFVVESCGENNQ